MPVLEVDFDGNVEDLQKQLDDEDFEADVSVQGDTAGAGGAGAQQDDGGLIGTATRGAIVGALITLVGLLSPVKEILEGIRNFFLLTLGPVIAGLRPLFEPLRDILISLGQFLSGDKTIGDFVQDAVKNLVQLLKTAVNGIVSNIDSALGFVDLSTPFTNVGGDGGSSRTGERVTQPTQTNQGGGFVPESRSSLESSLNLAGTDSLADRTDETKKQSLINSLRSAGTNSYGGDAGSTGLGE